MTEDLQNIYREQDKLAWQKNQGDFVHVTRTILRIVFTRIRKRHIEIALKGSCCTICTDVKLLNMVTTLYVINGVSFNDI